MMKKRNIKIITQNISENETTKYSTTNKTKTNLNSDQT